MYKHNEPIIIKQSPIVIVKDFLILQVIAGAVLFLMRIAADYGELYDKLFFASSISFHIAEAVFLIALETLIVFYIFFRWYKEYYEIKSDQIIYGRGILFRRQTLIPIKNIQTIGYYQGPLGKLTRYGNLEIINDNSTKTLKFRNLPDPDRLVAFILRLKASIRGNPRENLNLEELLSQEEHESLEFKSSFRWDEKQNKVNKNLERAVMKTVAAFMNSSGGHLVLGIDDNKNIVGIDKDYQSLPKTNADGFANHFNNVFHSMIGPEFRQAIRLLPQRLGDKEVCLVRVSPAHRPAYLKSEDREEFYIRTGNATTALRFSEAASYAQSHWSNTD